jgi:hypothetical protein
VADPIFGLAVEEFIKNVLNVFQTIINEKNMGG